MSQVQATDDHYATLGIAPRSEATEIRAAYLGLMRRFHPDRNDCPEAIERAHAIIAAFAVLGNVEKRLSYDWGRRRAAEAAAKPRRRWPGAMPKALIGVALAILVVVPLSFIASPRPDSDPPVAPPAAKGVADDPIRVPYENAVAEAFVAEMPVAAPEQTVAEPKPLEPPPAAKKVAERVEVPLPSILPPQEAPPREPRQARAIVRPLQQPASAKAQCRFAKPGAEAAVCNNDNLAALDRSVVAFYNQSLQFGAATKRGALLDSRDGFLVRREECRSDACLQGVHLDHLRELSAIVEKRESQPPR